VVSRIERKLLKILDELEMLDQQRLLITAELEAHRHIDADAQRDAVLGIDPLEATSTRDDVVRFHGLLEDLRKRREKVERIRDSLTARLEARG
jgi:hypothetical protein